MQIQVSQLIVKFLQQLGVETIFGMPGAHILPVYDDLYDSGIQTVLVKHEQGAAFMAGGYARVSGRIGACITTAGPGASNLITGIANAYADKLPMLVITGEAPTHIFGRGGLQESSGEGGSINQTALFSGVTRYHKLIERTDYLVNVLNQAARHLRADVPGPVVLSIPVNVQKELVDVAILSKLPCLNPLPKLKITPQMLEQCGEMIRAAERPVVLAGYGCIQSAQAHEILCELSDRLNMPVASSLKGKGAIDERLDLSLGSLGVTSGGYALHYLLHEADLIIMLGAGFNERTSYVWKTDLLEGKKIIQVDRNVAQLEKVFKADLAIQSDLGDFLESINNYCVQKWVEPKVCQDLTLYKRSIDRQLEKDNAVIFGEKFNLVKRFFTLLEQQFDDGIVLVDDNIIFSQNFYRVTSHDHFVPNTGVSSLGHAIPAAIGSRFVVDKPTFAILGDGGFQMCCMEIMTAVNYNIPLNIVLFNNQTLGLIRKNQHQQYQERFLDCDFKNPDYALLAQSFGITHFKIASLEDCRQVFDQADFYHGINLIELMIDRDAYPNYSSRR
ncbi:thiamine pyrophosphate-binding protein [Thiothrix fructosivorans]|uniref:Thiamine pyrophosphate-binding protein n=1 Tax=Thiothrix fructosivorans TaxID=111770 RepID=A0A8B0SH21_9GAMM|nr:thiamine pyrophosphate-binding protein [Thiothrix fructosivorans]MBO0614945.1 thiamine pyrophosphate-binding protein [Thiothrix fructosivorans]QTX09750.1 thiamine pyrophosphate-binding protein [Thiothrix fructosivorans]